MDFELLETDLLAAADRGALAALLDRAAGADGHPAVPEPQWRALVGSGHGQDGARVVLARRDGTVAGCAVLSRARDGSSVLHLVVDPSARPRADTGPGALASELVTRALDAATGAAPVHLWAMQAGPADDALARLVGFAPERDLVQMRVALPLPAEVVAATRPLATRPFAPGRDERAWVETNNRAFAGHPEQGGWTVAQLRERMQADWVDLDGFLVADDPDGAGLLGSCWTKIHRDRDPVLGEIYVIAVDPRHHGQGWGRALTVAGLESLVHRGITAGMLYTDADNAGAVALYRSLGFHVDHVDRSYRRDPSAPEGAQAEPTPVPMARPTA